MHFLVTITPTAEAADALDAAPAPGAVSCTSSCTSRPGMQVAALAP